MRAGWLISTLALPMATPALAAGAAPAAAPAEAVVEHVVAKGETLYSLARQFFIGRDAIRIVQQRNRIADPRRLPIARALRIPRALLRDEVVPARVETFSGPVTVQAGAAPRPVRLDEVLAEGAGIETGRNAFVTLRLGDGSALAVPSQSALRIVRLRRVLMTGALEREIAVSAGRLRARVTPMTDPGSHFRVTTPIAVSAVRGTEFRIAYEAAGGFSAAQVDEGKVAFAAGAAPDPLLLPPGFGAAEAAGKATGIVQLLPPPRLLDPGKVQSGEELGFALAPAAGAAGYHVQIARDAGFLEAIAEQTGASPQFTFPSLPADSYFLKVSAIDPVGLEGSGEVYSFERRRNAVSGQADAAPRRLRFRWDGVADGTPQYRFRMVRKGPVPVVVADEPGLTEKLVTLTNLGPGDYGWTVCSTIFVKAAPVTTCTAEQTIHVYK